MKEDAYSKSNREYKVSVIIPVYNAEKTLERAFLSVKNQTIGFGNIELLFCDDCSTDGSYALIKKWAAEYPNVKAFKTKRNSGTAGAPRNVCLDNVTAPYVMFLDNDDEYLKDACATMYEAILSNNTQLVCAGYYEHENGKTDKVLPNKWSDVKPGSYELNVNRYDLFAALLATMWNIIFKTEIINRYNLRLSDGYLGEDTVFVLLYGICVESCTFINDVILIHSFYSSNITTQIEKKFWMHGIEKSFEFGIKKACSIGKINEYNSILSQSGMIVNVLDSLINAEKLDSKEVKKLYERWRFLFAYAFDNNFNLHTAASRIVMREAFLNNTESALFCIDAFKELYSQRKEELNEIFSSTTWKLASVIQKLKFWSKS